MNTLKTVPFKNFIIYKKKFIEIFNMYTNVNESTSNKQLDFYKLRTGIVPTKQLIDEIELCCDEYIIVPGYRKTLFTGFPLQNVFKYYGLIKTTPQLLSLHSCGNLILNHVKIKCQHIPT